MQEVLDIAAEINQIDKPGTLGQIVRLPNGRFAPGFCPSPGNPTGKGYQKPSRRLSIIMNEMTVKELTELVEGEDFQGLIGIDAAIVQRAKSSVDGDASSIDFVFDRLEGKPTNKTELTGKDGNPLAIATADVTGLLLELADEIEGEK